MPRGRKGRSRRKRGKRVGKKARAGQVSDLRLPGDRPGSITIQRSLPVPDRMVVQLKVLGTTTITDPDTFSDLVVSGNSVFDPLAGLGSAQPSYFDLLAAIYGTYMVIRSTIQVQVLPGLSSGTAIVQNVRFGIAPRGLSTAFSIFNDLASQPYAVHNDTSLNAKPVRLVNSLSTSKLAGVSNVHEAVPHTGATVTSFGALVSANPTAEWFWHIGVHDPVTGTNTSVVVDIQLTFEVEFFNRLAHGNSFLQRSLEVKEARDEYLKLKALTPRKDGRVPPKQRVDPLREYVDSLREDSGWVLPGSGAELKSVTPHRPDAPSAGVRKPLVLTTRP